MKKLIAVACAALVSLSAFGQGSLLFQNVGPGLTTQGQIRDAAGALIGAGSAYTAELLAGTTATVASLSPIITTTSWAGNGWFGVGQAEKVLAGFAPGSLPFFAVRVWDNAGGTVTTFAAAQAAGRAYGQSAGAWQLPASTGGLGNPSASPAVPGPALIGMTGFQLIPEPSTYALLAFGAAALLFRRRK